VPAIVAEADLDGLRLSAANDFAVAPPGEKYLGAERFRVHLVGSVDPDGATHLTPSTIGVCNARPPTSVFEQVVRLLHV